MQLLDIGSHGKLIMFCLMIVLSIILQHQEETVGKIDNSLSDTFYHKVKRNTENVGGINFTKKSWLFNPVFLSCFPDCR